MPKPRFPTRKNGGTKKPSIFRRGGDEGWTAHNRHRKDSTPILSLARQLPGPHGPGLDERKKAGLLTSGSSYSLRLAVLLHSGFMELSSPVTAALPHRIFTCFPILPRRETGGTFLRVGPALTGQISKNWSSEYGVETKSSSGLSKPSRKPFVIPSEVEGSALLAKHGF